MRQNRSRVRAEAIFSHAAKAIEIEDIEARVAELEGEPNWRSPRDATDLPRLQLIRWLSSRMATPTAVPSNSVPELPCCVPPQKSAFSLFGTLLRAGELRTDSPGELRKLATASIRAASFASGFDLLVRSHVGLRRLRVQLGSGNLPIVPLGESFVHKPTVQYFSNHQAVTVGNWLHNSALSPMSPLPQAACLPGVDDV
jgi:hypothetical protein